MRSRWLASLIIVPLVLSACGGADKDPSASAPAGSDGGDQNASSGSGDEEPTVEIVDSGFVQSDESSVEAIVIVHTDDEAAIGEFVTATVNFLDADGQILVTEEQVESFSWVGQDLVLPVTAFDPNGTVATIDPSISLSDYGATEPVGAPLPVLDATEIQESGSPGYYTPSFGFTNETDTDLEDLRVGVVCYDDAMNIIGGGSTYPSVAPAGNTIRIDADGVKASETPASCKAFVNYGL